MTAVRWLLFDVGGVLETADDAVWPREFATRWAARLGLDTDEFMARAETADLPDASTRSGVEEEFWQRYGAAVGAHGTTLDEMRADFWDAYCGGANQPLLDLAAGLRGSVGLAILSNSGDGARREEERRYGFSRLFDPICYSHEIGVNKPDPRAFRAALDAMDARPADVLFIDNAPDNAATMAAIAHAMS